VNTRADHRLRTVFALPQRAATSRAECAFGVVERGLGAEGGPYEVGLPTFPSRRFVTAGGLTIVHEGLHEYELIDDGRALALTLLRSVAVLSRPTTINRPGPAGPELPVPGAQLLGPVEVRYAVHVGDRDPYALVDDAFLPLLVTKGGGGPQPAEGSLLRLTGAEVSAVVREAGALHVRVFNPTDQHATVRVEGRRGWLVDLRGRPLAPFEGGFELAPWAIATAALAD